MQKAMADRNEENDPRIKELIGDQFDTPDLDENTDDELETGSANPGEDDSQGIHDEDDSPSSEGDSSDQQDQQEDSEQTETPNNPDSDSRLQKRIDDLKDKKTRLSLEGQAKVQALINKLEAKKSQKQTPGRMPWEESEDGSITPDQLKGVISDSIQDHEINQLEEQAYQAQQEYMQAWGTEVQDTVKQYPELDPESDAYDQGLDDFITSLVMYPVQNEKGEVVMVPRQDLSPADVIEKVMGDRAQAQAQAQTQKLSKEIENAQVSTSAGISPAPVPEPEPNLDEEAFDAMMNDHDKFLEGIQSGKYK